MVLILDKLIPSLQRQNRIKSHLIHLYQHYWFHRQRVVLLVSRHSMTSPFTGGLKIWEQYPLLPPQIPSDSSHLNNKDIDKSTQNGLPQNQQQKDHPKSDQPSIDVASSKYGPPLVKSLLSLEERYEQCNSVGEECIMPHELRQLLERKDHPVCYDGFEPSGRMHIAQGVLKAINVNKLTRSGCVFVFWVADWFAMLNNKMGGDLEKIRIVGQYFIEVWKAVGMDMRNVRFLWASDEINKNPNGYWMRVMDIARRNNITRIKRCCQIMGRADGDDQPAAHILYPCMQCSDIFYLQADICQLGMDQRKVNMLAREYAEQIKLKTKPIILSHRMLPGLLEGQEKMSKSNPDSAIFMEDSVQDVNRKIKQAFCPPQVIEGNPCIAYVEALVFPLFNKFEVERKESNGGNITYVTVEEFRSAYRDGLLHPGDLKPNLAKRINLMIDPVRKHFNENSEGKALLAKIRNWKTS